MSGLLIGSAIFASQAGALTIGEGTGTSWCGTYGGANLGNVPDTHGTIYACEYTGAGNKSGATPFDGGTKFQCTELANRYLYNFNGDSEFDSKYNNGNLVGGNFVSSVATQYGISTGSSGGSAMPVAGDIISMWGGSQNMPQNGSDTHVAIVTNVNGGTIQILNENASGTIDTPPPGGNGLSTISVSGSSWTTNGGYYTDFEWLNLNPATSSGPVPVTLVGPGSGPAGFATAVYFNCPNVENFLLYQYLDGVQTSGTGYAGTPEGNYPYFAATSPTTSLGKHTVVWKCYYAPNFYSPNPAAGEELIGTTAPLTLDVTSPALSLQPLPVQVTPGQTFSVTDGRGFGAGSWGSTSELYFNGTDIPLTINSAGHYSPVSVTVPSNAAIGSTIYVQATALSSDEAITTAATEIPVVSQVSQGADVIYFLEYLVWLLSGGS
jgi:hypothetical protein